MCDHAEEWGWATHGELVLLGQLHGRQLHRQVGEQDDVLHRVRLRARHLMICPTQAFVSLIHLFQIT